MVILLPDDDHPSTCVHPDESNNIIPVTRLHNDTGNNLVGTSACIMINPRKWNGSSLLYYYSEVHLCAMRGHAEGLPEDNKLGYYVPGAGAVGGSGVSEHTINYVPIILSSELFFP
jgi:hypothetical protein